MKEYIKNNLDLDIGTDIFMTDYIQNKIELYTCKSIEIYEQYKLNENKKYRMLTQFYLTQRSFWKRTLNQYINNKRVEV